MDNYDGHIDLKYLLTVILFTNAFESCYIYFISKHYDFEHEFKTEE